MCHPNLKVSSIGWWLERLCYIRQNVGQSKLSCPKDESDGDEDIKVDAWVWGVQKSNRPINRPEIFLIGLLLLGYHVNEFLIILKKKFELSVQFRFLVSGYWVNRNKTLVIYYFAFYKY